MIMDTAAFYSQMNLFRQSNPKQYVQVREGLSKLTRFSWHLKFELFFSWNEAVLQLVKETTSKDDVAYWDRKMAVDMLQGDRRYCLDTRDSIQLYEEGLYYNPTIVHANQAFNVLEWTISEQQENIGAYICQQATSPFAFKSYRGGTIATSVTAWFAPSLPFPYGPQGYHSLPGLILSYQVSRGFRASDIEIVLGSDESMPQLIEQVKCAMARELNKQAKERMRRIKHGN